MSRYFTVEEANALLPVLRPYVKQTINAWRHLSAIQNQVVAILERVPRNDLGGPLLSRAASDIIRAQNALIAIQALGVLLKDPAIGLLDFPSMHNGVEVYLCWRYNEQRIGFWHPIDAGFAGRQPIDE